MSGDTLLFNTFGSQEERRKFGGSYFIEIQYCRLAPDTPIEKIVDADAIKFWKSDSLYIHGDNDNKFVSLYGKIFTNGTYSNGKKGCVDICGINYYSKEQTYLIIEKIKETKPLDYQTLLVWLEMSKNYTGFYILGL